MELEVLLLVVVSIAFLVILLYVEDDEKVLFRAEVSLVFTEVKFILLETGDNSIFFIMRGCLDRYVKRSITCSAKTKRKKRGRERNDICRNREKQKKDI